ncbi:MAG: hypothetical protein IKW66_02725, partial [Clostridia bacterium]|nr:hypothetical protein [Clostridia bacterium]
MKKILCFVFALLLAFGLVACDKGEVQTTPPPAESTTALPAESTTAPQEALDADDFFDQFFDDGYLDDEDFYEKHGMTPNEYFDEDYFKDVPYASLTSLPDVMGYGDRVADEFKLRRELLTEEEKRLYDEFLPYVLSFTPFTVDYRDMDYELDAITHAMNAIKLDYPETWLYFSYGSNLDGTLRDDEGYYGRFVSFGATYFYLEWNKAGIAAFDAKAIE